MRPTLRSSVQFGLILSVVMVGLFGELRTASACIAMPMSAGQALASTDLTLLGEVLEILPGSQDLFSRSFFYKVRALGVERGRLKAGTEIEIEFLLHLARPNRDGSIRCPIQRGSGIESQLKVGECYSLALKKMGNVFDLYRAEVLSGCPRPSKAR